MDFSMSALQGQTVMQWPQETQLDPAISCPPSHCTRGWGSSQSIESVSLTWYILAGLDAASAQNALVRIVAVEGVGFVLLVRLGEVGVFLVLDLEQRGGVVDGAVAVVVVADRAVEQVVAEDAIEGFSLSGAGVLRFGLDDLAGGDLGGAGADQLAVYLDHAGVAGLDRAQAVVVTHLGDFLGVAIQRIDEPLALKGKCITAVDANGTFAQVVRILRMRGETLTGDAG